MPGRWASLGLVAVVLLMIVSVGALTYRPESTDPTSIPAGFVATPSPERAGLPDVPMPGANPARTNVQPGLGLTMLPEIVQRSDLAGQEMVLADDTLLIVSGLQLTAVDAMSMNERWSTRLAGANYSSPIVADGRIYLGLSRNTESVGTRPGDNGLMALSMDDGHELWNVDDAGIYPVSPLVVNDVVYSLGVRNDHYLLGAYQVADGEPIWQVETAPYEWCCPSTGIAFADGLLAINSLDTIAVHDAVDGREVWSDTLPDTGEFGQSTAPVIAGDLLIVSFGNESDLQSPQTPIVGATTGYELRSGEVRWRNESTRSFFSRVAAPKDVIYAGRWVDSDGGEVALLAAETGEELWRISIPRASTGDPVYNTGANAITTVVDDTVYVLSATSAQPGGSITGSLVSAIDLETGAVWWTAQIDGAASTMPIVAGGRIFVVTHDAGLYVLGNSQTLVPETATTVDLRTPLTCPAAPTDSPMLGDLPAEPSVPGVADWKQMIRFSQIPVGTGRVDPAVADQIAERFREYRACSAIDPYRSVFGFFSTDFYVRLNALPEWMYDSKEQPWAVWMTHMGEFLSVDTNSLQQLPDGRIGGIVNSPIMNSYVWWVMEDGQWKIDEFHRIEADPVDPNAATPTPQVNAEGTPLG
jgi:outer membrane protein assembly factor BamB